MASGSIVLVIDPALDRGGEGVSVLGRGVLDPLAVDSSLGRGRGIIYRCRTSHATEYTSQKLTEDPGPKDAFQGVEGGGAVDFESWIFVCIPLASVCW